MAVHSTKWDQCAGQVGSGGHKSIPSIGSDPALSLRGGQAGRDSDTAQYWNDSPSDRLAAIDQEIQP